jgi:hypothetical protein
MDISMEQLMQGEVDVNALAKEITEYYAEIASDIKLGDDWINPTVATVREFVEGGELVDNAANWVDDCIVQFRSQLADAFASHTRARLHKIIYDVREWKHSRSRLKQSTTLLNSNTFCGIISSPTDEKVIEMKYETKIYNHMSEELIVEMSETRLEAAESIAMIVQVSEMIYGDDLVIDDNNMSYDDDDLKIDIFIGSDPFVSIYSAPYNDTRVLN